MTRSSAQAVLARVLDALAQELIETSDEEVFEAARSLRMDPSMPESAAFAGVTYPGRPQLSDYFDLEARGKLSTDRKPPRKGK
jgi:hypothetical protein